MGSAFTCGELLRVSCWKATVPYDAPRLTVCSPKRYSLIIPFNFPVSFCCTARTWRALLHGQWHREVLPEMPEMLDNVIAPCSAELQETRKIEESDVTIPFGD
jgi:hypothetical protein